MNTFTLDDDVLDDARIREDQCECPRCGQGEKLPLPMPVEAIQPWHMYFRIKHRWCKKP